MEVPRPWRENRNAVSVLLLLIHLTQPVLEKRHDRMHFATSKPVTMFDSKTFAILKKIDVQGNPDGYLNDAYNHHFYILRSFFMML